MQSFVSFTSIFVSDFATLVLAAARSLVESRAWGLTVL